MREHVAFLMPHQGCAIIGKTIEEATKNAKVLEALVMLQYGVVVVGEPDPLPQSMLDMLVKKAYDNNSIKVHNFCSDILMIK